MFYYSVVRTNEHLNIRTKEYGSVAIHKATASRLGISHYVRNDKPVVVDKGTKKGGLAAFLCSLPYICWVIPSAARNLIQFCRMAIVQLFSCSNKRTSEHSNNRISKCRNKKSPSHFCKGLFSLRVERGMAYSFTKRWV